MDSNGKVALITGGKRIGAVVATTLARAGVDIALLYNRSLAEAAETEAAVTGLGRRAMLIQADVTNERACLDAVAAAVNKFGRLDILINMASRYASKPFNELTTADWDQQLDVDLRAAFIFSHAAAPAMKQGGGGRIINFTDWVAASARPRYPGYTPYYVAKAGVKALTETLALDSRPTRSSSMPSRPGRSSRRPRCPRKKATAWSRARRSAAGAAKRKLRKR